MLPRSISWHALLLGMLLPLTAQANVYLQQFSPQGEVRDANRATAVFSGDMVKLGATDSPAPFEIQCSVAGTGRWSDTHTWTYSLGRALNPGERCRFTLKSSLKALDGGTVYGQREFLITTPGPWIQNINPRPNASIEEDQAFIIDVRMPVSKQTVEAHAWCEAEGVGERIPVQVLPVSEYQAILRGLRWSDAPNRLGIRCSRPLPPGAKMKLVWGRGIASDSGAQVLDDDAYTYQVRTPFRAELTCQRERPNAPCSALSDVWLEFSDRVDRKLAEKIRLVSQSSEQQPWDYSKERKAALIALGQKLMVAMVPSGQEDNVDRIVFKGPFPPDTAYTITLPNAFQDLSGRPLSNAASFPLKTRVGALPPLVKFAADFGILERKEGGVLPVTMRNTEGTLKMRVLRETNDAEMIKTWLALAKFEQQTTQLSAPDKHKMSRRTREGNEHTDMEAGSDVHYAREFSYLAARRDAEQRDLPKPGGPQQFEVVGIPLTKPGFYVVEIESQLLGKSFLKSAKPMFVRSQALVTDMAVHFKKGRDNSLVWVTSLATGKPVPSAEVNVYGCLGGRIWTGKTDARGIAPIDEPLAQNANCAGSPVYFATARLGDDFSFVRSDWTKGIEPWRFNVDSWSTIASPKIHTLLDRTLLRVGETVSMKHIARIPHAHGFKYPKPEQLPKNVTLQLSGGDVTVTLPLVWDARGVATSQWRIPDTAKLGTYAVQMNGWQSTAEFRVSEFRLPKYKGAVAPDKPRFADVKKVPLRLSLAYLNGGAANGQTVQVSGLLSRSYVNFPRYNEFHFGIDYDGYEEKQLVADKQEVKLDKQGGARLELPLSGKVDQPMRLLAEMTFSDPGGEVQTIAGETELWPSEIAVGVRVKDWASLHGTRKIEAVALDVNGKPLAGVPVAITGERNWNYVHRKRILGGFYSYETESHSDDLGTLCKGKTDSLGLFNCEVNVRDAGEIKLHVAGSDSHGNESRADTGYWSSGDGDFWFEQEDQDRMDVVPEKREYEAGDTARFQVHTPFREATALITVEREGVVESFVRPLLRNDAVVSIPVGDNWGPNVYVSVLAVRGRLRDVPWYSFFQWGWHSPVEWWNAWRDTVPQASALVDLARPSFKLGLTRIEVGNKGARLQVELSADKAAYSPRATAKVKIRVLLPNGKPAPAGSEVMVAAVDRALLELSPNPTWNLLDDMMQERAYLMETSTAQMQVVGKRHFGKKALPAGGGGGKLSSRELFDTLLYWNPRVKLGGDGTATIEVPLNDSLTAFKIVAVADVDAGLFGTGDTEITTTQDLQITAALPPLVREGDSYRAMVSLRNSTASAMRLNVQGSAGAVSLPARAITLAAGEAQEVFWQVEVPAKQDSLPWMIEALDEQNRALDRIKFTQKIQPRVPVTTQQAMFMRVEKPYSVATGLPEGALPGRGGIEVRLTARMADQTDGIQRFFRDYPFSCLEQKVSLAAGLQDAQRWNDIVRNLAGYLDAQGFAQYFPGAGRGSEALTAYLLVMAQENGIKLPEELEARMQKALLDFAEGRVKPANWLYGERDYLPERRLSALEALAHRGKVTGLMLTAYEFKPIKMPTITLIDWYSLLRRVPDAPQRAERLQQVERELRNRMSYVGGRLVFSTEGDDYWWWLMVNGEVNALRLLNVVMDDPAWKNDLPALMRGALLRQSRGHWATTVANVWGSMALKKFGDRFEREVVSGTTTASIESGKEAAYNWSKAKPQTVAVGGEPAQLQLPWPAGEHAFSLSHQGGGKPWATVMMRAAVPGKTVESGYRIKRSFSAIEQKVAGQWSRGDLLRVRIDVDSDQSMSWVALSDPIPGGASIMGNTARDSKIAQEGENDYRPFDGTVAYPAYTERGLGFFRAYYDYVPKGHFWYEYTLRLNNPGEFFLPPTRVEAMYAPEVFGQLPNESLTVRQP
ncbi:MAG TPA: MG2 domain-containing protein [Gallionella sp.]|nr:MG2 domain-containing protein [Gallionella sp.]